MTILNREFRDLGELELERGEDGIPVEHAPQARYSKASCSSLHKYGQGAFCKFRVRGLPRTSGVYLFTLSEMVVYAGRAVDLQKRFSMGYGNISPKNCFHGGQQTNCRINQLVLNAVRNGLTIHVLVHECQDQDDLEKHLISHLRPEWNRA